MNPSTRTHINGQRTRGRCVKQVACQFFILSNTGFYFTFIASWAGLELLEFVW